MPSSPETRAQELSSVKRHWFRLALLWLAGIDLRLTVLAVPPLLPAIHRTLSLDEKAVAILTVLPVLLLAVASTLGSLLTARFDARRALILGIAIIGVSSGLRGVGPALPVLFGTTFLMGAGIAISQPAFPSLVYEWFPDQIGLATAVYTNGLLSGEMMSTALTTTVVMPAVGESWALAFFVWALPVVFTAILFSVATQPITKSGADTLRAWRPDFSDGQTWRLGLIQGGTSIIYFGANAFIPDYLSALGRAGLVAPTLAMLSAGQVPASILIALFPRHLTGRLRPLQVTALLTLAGLAVFLVGSGVWCVGAAFVLGFCSSFAFVSCLALPPIQAKNPDDVHRVSAGMFTIGYTLAFFLPLLGGTLWDVSSIAATCFVPVALGGVLILAATHGLRTTRWDQAANALAKTGSANVC